MFERKKIGDIRAYLNGFDRIFIDASLLGEDALSEKAVTTLLSSVSKKHCIVLNEQTMRGKINKVLVKKLLDKGLLLVRGNQQIVMLQTSYYNAAIELAKRKNYKLLLLTNVEKEGNEFDKLGKTDLQEQTLGACGVQGNGFFSYLYAPPVSEVSFSIRATDDFESLQILFLKTLGSRQERTLYDRTDKRTFAKKKLGRRFAYVIPKSEVNDFDSVQFIAKQKGMEYTSARFDFFAEEEQSWSLFLANGALLGRIQRESQKDEPQKSKRSADEDVPDSEKYPYFGGKEVRLPPDVKIEIKEELAAGATVTTRSGKKIKLVEKLGAGGEGTVFSTDVKGVACKILNNKTGNNLTKNKQEKIEFMTQHPVNHPLVVWPIDAVYAEGKFVGFTMKSIPDRLELRGIVDQMQFPNGNLNTPFGVFNLTKTQIVDMILSLLDTLTYLHRRNIILGDIKLENFVVQNNDVSKIYFVDCDSYQVGRFPATKVSPGYMPPELMGKKVDTVYRTFGNEYYAVFALLFMILHKGKKPYEQLGEAMEQTEEQRAALGIFPYFLQEEKTLAHAPKGYPVPNWSHLPGYLKKAFCAVASKNGDRFGESKRYTAKEWLTLFLCYRKDLANGKLRARDKDYDVGIHGVRAVPIAYSAVDLKLSEIFVKEMGDVTLKGLILALFQSAQQKPSSALVEQVERTLRTHTEYKDSFYRFVLKKNLGCYYSVEFTCRA